MRVIGAWELQVTYRVEITTDETRRAFDATVEITVFIDRVPETNEAGIGRIIRVPGGVWTTRLYYAGDFAVLGEALAAVEAAHPDVDRIRCYEWSNDDETPVEVAPLVRSGGKWSPGQRS
jgi:hypothetical protein